MELRRDERFRINSTCLSSGSNLADLVNVLEKTMKKMKKQKYSDHRPDGHLHTYAPKGQRRSKCSWCGEKGFLFACFL